MMSELIEICEYGTVKRPDDDKIQKLPKWARSYIFSLEKTRDHLHRVASEYHNEKSRIRCETHLTTIGLPENANIEFDLQSSITTEIVRIKLTKSGALYVNGTHQLAIKPCVSNAIEIVVI